MVAGDASSGERHLDAGVRVRIVSGAPATRARARLEPLSGRGCVPTVTKAHPRVASFREAGRGGRPWHKQSFNKLGALATQFDKVIVLDNDVVLVKSLDLANPRTLP